MDETEIVVTGNFGPSEIDKQAAEFIDTFAKEFNAANLEAEEKALTPPGDTKDENGQPVNPDGNNLAGVEGQKAAAGDPVPPPKEETADDRGLSRLVEREVALRTRAAELDARESRVSGLEARIRELETQARPAPDWDSKDPEDVLREQGQDPDVLVRRIIAKRLGKTNDPQVQQVIETTKMKRELSDIKNQMASQAQAARAQAFVAQVEAGARAHVNKGIGEHAPTVSAIAKVNPDRVYAEIMQEISTDAARKAQAGGGDVLTYDDAVKRVETRWSEFKALVTPASQAPASMAPQGKATEPVQKPKDPPAATTKSPDRPIAPWLRRETSIDDGIRAGIAEFRRLETPGK